MKIDQITESKRIVRECKAVRDRVYDREQFGGAVLLRELQPLLVPGCTIVDVGCGRDAKFLRSLPLNNVQTAYGVDIEICGTQRDGKICTLYGDAEAIPLEPESVDLVMMRDVVEHLRDPERVFQECERILKPGGSVLLVAPCKYYPPLLLVRALPHKIRQTLNAIVTRTRSEDTFPVYYRANSARDLKRLAEASALQIMSMQYLIYHPQYYMFSTIAYRAAVLMERTILRPGKLAFLRHQVFCHLKKPCARAL
jgi:ubiquinone/menaquinone biosynthesis C-methylase UbiE